VTGQVRFDGRVAVVTGAGAGMGRSHARVLAERGARVVVNDVREDAATDVVDEIRAAGGDAVVAVHDIATDEGASALIDAAVDAFGAVDAVVNNAGGAPKSPFESLSWDLLEQTLRLNCAAPFFVTRYAWPFLRRSGAGRVVMVASKSALMGGVKDSTHYATAKGAVIAMTRQLAAEGGAEGIHVNAVLPTALTKVAADGTATLNPLKARMAERLGVDPADAARLADRSAAAVSAVVAWLCHAECASNGELFNAVAGHASRVSFAAGEGINDPALTVETVRDRMAAIADLSTSSVLPSTWDGDLSYFLP
jgi:NAD(P)-dependent dehydrogenase (short-subunit alcohol dehydrogenase family)